MNALRDAIRKRRLDGGPAARTGAEGSPAPSAQGQSDQSKLKDLVSSLTEEQKQSLMGMLSGQSAETSAQKIQAGEASSEEKQKIAEKVQEEQRQSSPQPALEDDEDEIAAGLIDSRFKNASSSQPRNLNDRVQMKIASRLKEKGKF